MTLAQFYIWKGFGIIGEPLVRLEESLEVIWIWGYRSFISCKGTIRVLQGWVGTHGSELPLSSLPPSLFPSLSSVPQENQWSKNQELKLLCI